MKRKVVIRRAKPRPAPRSSESTWSWRTTLFAGGVFLVLGLLVSGMLLWRSGWFQKQADLMVASGLEMTRKAGFSVENILVEGRNQTDKDLIVSVLQGGIETPIVGSPILAFNPHDALKRLGDISWVKSGVVERRLPSTIFIRLYEREPIALWQNNKVIKLIDREGHALRDIGKEEAPSLPLVVGEGANTHAADLIAQLLQYQSILTPLRAAVRVSNRRWDLHMTNNIVVKLPEENLGTALQRLNKAIAEQHIFDRNIVALDLRLPDRMIVETTETIEQPKAPKSDSKI